MHEEKPQIDHNALSRQLAVYGAEAQGKLMSMRVLIHGLTGVKYSNLFSLPSKSPRTSSSPVPNKSLSSTKQSSPSKMSAETFTATNPKSANAPALKPASPNSKNSTPPAPSALPTTTASNSCTFLFQLSSNNFECVVICDNHNREYLVKLNKACRDHKVGFILAGNLGLYGYTFVDFGEAHTVFDMTGEESKLIHLAGITRDEKATVYLHEDKRHGLNDGDTVEFKEVKGMAEINGMKFKVEVKTPGSFLIGDTSKFSVYENGGMCIETKVPVHMKFHDLEKSLRYPYPPDSMEMPIASWEKFGVPEQLHLILNGVYDFWAKHQRLPAILNEAEAQE